MKKIILALLLFVIFIPGLYGQDDPSGHTEHYSLRKWAENANPSADSLNANWDDIDSVLYDLIVSIDSNHFKIEDDELKLSDTMAGTDAFTTTATTCTVAVSGMEEGDVVVLTPVSNAFDADDQLSVTVEEGQFIVTRNSDGTSDLEFNWIWIKKYDE